MIVVNVKENESIDRALKRFKKKFERIQSTAMKMVTELKNLTHEERLKEMGLPTLHENRVRSNNNIHNS